MSLWCGILILIPCGPGFKTSSSHLKLFILEKGIQQKLNENGVLSHVCSTCGRAQTMIIVAIHPSKKGREGRHCHACGERNARARATLSDLTISIAQGEERRGEKEEEDRVTQLLKHDIKRGRGRIRGMRKIVNILTREGRRREWRRRGD